MHHLNGSSCLPLSPKMGAISRKKIFTTFLIFLCFDLTVCFPDQGKWNFKVSEKSCNFFQIHKALYKDSQISIKIMCDPASDNTSSNQTITIGWVVRQTPCYEEYLVPEVSMPYYLNWYYTCPVFLFGDFGYNKIRYLKRKEFQVTCNHLIHLLPGSDTFREEVIDDNSINCHADDVSSNCSAMPEYPYVFLKGQEAYQAQEGVQVTAKRRRRAAIGENLQNSIAESNPQTTKISGNDAPVQVPVDGVYLFILLIRSSDKNFKFTAEVDIAMKSYHGYLSAIEWPLLPFYGVMCIFYVIFAVAWLVVSAMQWRDLLRIQFWIGGVIFLGMVEKAVFYAEYQSINSTGQSVKGAVLFAEIISCLKRTLARMLVIIVSLGFGIVKPRLGAMLHRVVCVGGLYFVLGSIEAMLRVYKPKNDPTNQTLMAGVPLAVLDSVICWWVFSSLVQTTRTLRLRRNLVKLNLYRLFTNTLIFAVVASVTFMVWVIHSHKLTMCLTDWKELWIDDAFWHLLFSLVLLVIMILWRPTNNNTRYAFTPLLDASDDEEDLLHNEQKPHEAFDGMKMRPQNRRDSDASPSQSNNSHPNANKNNEQILSKQAQEDLKWLDENLPSGIDGAFPGLVDSDEEIMTARFERNKME